MLKRWKRILCVLFVTVTLSFLKKNYTLINKDKFLLSKPYHTTILETFGFETRICDMETHKKHVKRMCSKLVGGNYNETAALIVSDELKVAYCPISKHASTTFGNFFISSTRQGRLEHNINPHIENSPNLATQYGLRNVKYPS